MIVLVAAVARNGVIGVAGGLPWSIPADLRHFRAVTLGKPIIMGRATFDAIGRPLPGRTNIVLTRNAGFSAEGVQRASDADEALEIARAHHGNDAEICVIGGGQIYSLYMEAAGRMELTIVDAAPAGDTKFPQWDRSEWIEAWSESHDGPPPFRFVRYMRQPAPGLAAR